MLNFFKKNPKEQQENEIIETQSEQPFEEKGFFGMSVSSFKDAISKTGESLVGGIAEAIGVNAEIDEDILDEIEEKLLKADLGLDATVFITDRIKQNKKNLNASNINAFLKNEFTTILNNAGANSLNIKENNLNIILIAGVNGAGKTTLIGKLAYRYKSLGKKVVVAAGDTFRAAAEEQLEIWTKRAGAEIIRKDGADPASVVFDAIKYSEANNADILLVDTAGRLQNKFNLMEELRKIKKIIDREAPEKLVESILVLDATTGQNGLKQAEVFKEAIQISSVALTKLDGTSKGGVIVSIAKDHNLPVKLIGVGEKMEDLRDFSPEVYVNALFD
ncbi:MAG: signal recognition particle-docking protein FtsY [bacterium]